MSDAARGDVTATADDSKAASLKTEAFNLGLGKPDTMSAPLNTQSHRSVFDTIGRDGQI